MYNKNQLILFVLNGFKYITFTKIVNFFLIVFSYLFSRIYSKFKSFPSFISIEPADFCQLECPACPVGIQKRKQGTRFNLDLFSSIIQSLHSKLFHVIFYFQGEPLLHPQLCEMIKVAHDAKVLTSTSTNAQLLNNNNAKEIVLSGLDKLIVSIDGVTQDVYASYRVGGKLDLALKGIEHINYWKKQFNSNTPFVEIQFVVFKTNEHQLDEMKVLAQKLGVFRLSFKSAQLYNYENGHPLLTSLSRFSRYKLMPDGTYKLKYALPNKCFRAWSGAVVSSNGHVLPCCFDKDTSHSYGSLQGSDFKTIYTGQNAQLFKQSILQNRKQHEMCRNCTSH